MNLNALAPTDAADEILAQAARAERSEAAVEVTRGQLLHARQLNTLLERTLTKIRLFHDTWGETEDADQLALWEDLGQLLAEAAPQDQAVVL